jgi:hypothetical protein
MVMMQIVDRPDKQLSLSLLLHCRRHGCRFMTIMKPTSNQRMTVSSRLPVKNENMSYGGLESFKVYLGAIDYVI